jgi:hypothetical protein
MRIALLHFADGRVEDEFIESDRINPSHVGRRTPLEYSRRHKKTRMFHLRPGQVEGAPVVHYDERPHAKIDDTLK